MSNEGKNASVHYVGTLDDGSEFDSSRRRGEPLRFTCMAGQMIPGFDAAVRDMNVGETVNVHLEPEEAYGPRNEAVVVAIPRSNFPQDGEPKVGSSIMLMSPQGKPVPAVIASFDDQTVKFDINHPMAGKALNFEIELLSAE